MKDIIQCVICVLFTNFDLGHLSHHHWMDGAARSAVCAAMMTTFFIYESF